MPGHRSRTATRHPRRVYATMLALVMAILGSTAEADAQTAKGDRPAGSPGRFMMQPSDNGVLRLDTETGNMSFCRKGADGWACEALADERRALEDENKRLKADIADMKSVIARLEELLGVDEKPKSRGPGFSSLPTEQDIDRAADYIRGMLKKLKEKVREFEGDATAPKRS